MTRHRNSVMFKIMTLAALLLAGIAVARAADHGDSHQAAITPGQVGSQVDDFTLTDTDGNQHTLSSYLKQDKLVVLEWFNPDCPYVRKYHVDGNESMSEAYKFAAGKDIVWMAVNSNAPGKQGSGLEYNRKAKADYGIDYPVLLDESGAVGMNFGASSTPQIFIIGEDRKVLYNGGADDTVLNTDEPGINYVINAISQHMADEDIDPAMTKHPGCSVKYAK